MRWGPRVRSAHAAEMFLVEITDNKILRLTAWIWVKTAWVNYENIKQLKSEDIDSTWEVYKRK